ncbi:hypothetical protein OCB15_17990 [Bacillus cereus]|nr:hypothetical protein [Bacillus cereus]
MKINVKTREVVKPIKGGDIVSLDKQGCSVPAFYVVNADNYLVNMYDGCNRYKGRCYSMDQLRDAIEGDSDVKSWKHYPKAEWTIDMIEKGGN